MRAGEEMSLRVHERRRETDYLLSLQRYEAKRFQVLEDLQAREQALEETLLCRDHESKPWKHLAEKSTATTAALSGKYKGLKRKQLPRHCVNRRLTKLDDAAKAEDLRQRLQASDLLFDEHFPDDDRLADLPWKRLRAAASVLGVLQGDQNSRTLVENLTEFATYRFILSEYNRLTKSAPDESE